MSRPSFGPRAGDAETRIAETSVGRCRSAAPHVRAGWVKAGKSYPQMRSIVVTLARVSLANRDLKFPDTREAGLEAGRGIAQDCKADPNGLLFATVDKRVRAAVEGGAAVVK